VGPVTKAQNPEDNGKKLTAADCRTLYMNQMDLALGHTSNKVGSFYNRLSRNLSDAQAKIFRSQLVKNIHSMIINAMVSQGAAVNQDPACVTRLMTFLQTVDSKWFCSVSEKILISSFVS
jgi:hypothetical protein